MNRKDRCICNELLATNIFQEYSRWRLPRRRRASNAYSIQIVGGHETISVMSAMVVCPSHGIMPDSRVKVVTKKW
jgi:hypothetical protein